MQWIASVEQIEALEPKIVVKGGDLANLHTPWTEGSR
jgi:hypothetical protein